MFVKRSSQLLLIALLLSVLGVTYWKDHSLRPVSSVPDLPSELINTVQAASLAWEKTGGPVGGLGYDVRYGSADQTKLFVTDNYSGVNVSNDGGLNWQASNNGITARFGASQDAIPVFSLTVDPNDYNIVWVGMKDVKGVYKSMDGGVTFFPATPPIPEEQFVFRGFTIEPGNSNVVYAAGEIPTNTAGKAFDRVLGRVYRTADGGATWQAIWDGDNLARYVIINPDNHDEIYISLGIFDREAFDSSCANIPPVLPSAQGSGGVVKGVYNGTTWSWTNMNNGLTDLYVGSLVMHPNEPSVMLAGAGNNACSNYWDGSQWKSSGGVFLTDDGGQHWSKTLANDTITAVEFAPSSSNIAYAGGQHNFYRSLDGGETWTKVAGHSFPWGAEGVASGFPIDILVDPNDPHTLFVNNYGGGNVKSSDGGSTWTLASQGYTGALMFDVEVHPTNPSTVYATARSGAFKGTLGGAIWSGMAYPPTDFGGAYAIAMRPKTPTIMLASNELLGTLFRSVDSGLSWQKVFTLPGVVPGDADKEHGLKRIVFAPSDNQAVYAGACRGSVHLQAGRLDSKGVYKSNDGGINWSDANNGYAIKDQCVNDIVVHPDNHYIVYAATADSGVWKTTDGGTSWSQLSGLPSDVRSLAIHPALPRILFAGTQIDGVYRSGTSGSSWYQIPAGMDANERIWAVEFNPVNPGEVWAGSIRSGVYRWEESAWMWSKHNSELRTKSIVDLAISHDGDVLYAATSGEGVFRLGEVPIWTVYLPLTRR